MPRNVFCQLIEHILKVETVVLVGVGGCRWVCVGGYRWVCVGGWV